MNHAISVPPHVPPGLTIATWGALFDLLTARKQPEPRTGAKLLALGLVAVVGERAVIIARGHSGSSSRRRVVPRYALTPEGERVARCAPSTITGIGGPRR